MTRRHKSHALAELLESGDCPPEVIRSAAAELRRLHRLMVDSNRLVFKRRLEIRRLQDKLYSGLTDDCIVKLARQAGEYQEDRVMTPHALYRFKVLVAAAERERIATEFDRRAMYSDGTPSSGWYEPHEPAEIVRSMK